MEYFDKKITYLRGLCDGSGFDPDTKEGKIFHGIMDILEDMAFMLETFLDDEELEEMELDEEETEEFCRAQPADECCQHGNPDSADVLLSGHDHREVHQAGRSDRGHINPPV